MKFSFKVFKVFLKQILSFLYQSIISVKIIIEFNYIFVPTDFFFFRQFWVYLTFHRPYLLSCCSHMLFMIVKFFFFLKSLNDFVLLFSAKKFVLKNSIFLFFFIQILFFEKNYLMIIYEQLFFIKLLRLSG